MKKIIRITLIIFTLIIASTFAFLFFISYQVGNALFGEDPPYEKYTFGNPPVTFYIRKFTKLVPEGDFGYKLYSSDFEQIGSSARLYLSRETDPESEKTIIRLSDDSSPDKTMYCLQPALWKLLPPENCTP